MLFFFSRMFPCTDDAVAFKCKFNILDVGCICNPPLNMRIGAFGPVEYERQPQSKEFAHELMHEYRKKANSSNREDRDKKHGPVSIAVFETSNGQRPGNHVPNKSENANRYQPPRMSDEVHGR